MKKLILLFSLLAGLLGAYGQAGSLDPSFAGKGWTFTDFVKSNTNNDRGRQVLTQPDGALLVVFDVNGYTMLARYLSNGILDRNFGMEGYSVAVNMVDAKAAVRKDGRIVVAGNVFNPATSQNDIVLARFTSSGLLDVTFDGDGKVSTYLEGLAFVRDMALQSDDKILITGGAPNAPGDLVDFALARFHEDGSFDQIEVTDFGNADAAHDLFIQSDGKILVAGHAYNSSTNHYDFAVARYHSDLSLDETFGVDGQVTTDFGGNDYARAIVQQADGKIVAAGQLSQASPLNLDFAIARYHADGSLDNSFDGDGKVITDFGSDDFADAIAVQSTGKIIVVGHAAIGNTDFSDVVLARYNSNGSLDNSFDGDGKVFTDFGYEDYGLSVALQDNDQIVIAGYAFILMPEENTDYIVARYSSDGVLDASFDEDGKLFGYYPERLPSIIRDVAVQSDGKVIVAGRVADPSTGNADIGLARYHPDGTLDKSFGGEGMLTTDFGSLDEMAYAVAVQSDGKIVVAGEAYFDSWNIIVARYNQDGTLDVSFDSDGKVVTAVGTGASAYAIALSGDKIVVAGGAYNFSENGFDFVVVRYQPDGSLDNTFDGDGIAITDFRDNDQAFAVAVQPDGKVVVAGDAFTSSGSKYEVALARYNTDGSLDNTFDGDGKVTCDFGGTEYARAIALQNDGKIVVAGEVDYDFALWRYQPDGALDASFSGDGIVTTDFGYEEAAWGIAMQGDSKIVITGGTHYPTTNHSDFALARYLPDGTLDPTFDGDGKVVTDFGYDEFVYAAAIYNGRLYAAGTSTGVTDLGTVLERGLLAAYRLVAAGAEICGNKVDDNSDGQIDEGCPGLPFLTVDDITVSESQRRAVVTVSLSKKTDQKVFVDYFTRGGTARTKAFKQEGKDYEPNSGTLSIPVGKQRVSFVVKITNDDVWEKDEYFKVQLHNAVQATIRKAQATVTIADDDVMEVAPAITGITAKEEDQKGGATLAVRALPNPAVSYFTLVLQGSGVATIRITDAAGRLVESRQGVAAHATLQIGHNYRPGVYYAEVVQGKERVVVKLLKQGQ